MEHARGAFDCARTALDRGEYDTAENLAAAISKRFPYSKFGVLSEELLADVLAARHEYADAAESYELFIRFHPTHERLPEIRRKLAEVQTQLAQ